MKKKIGISVLISIVVVLLVGGVWFVNKGLSFHTARCIVTRQGYMMVVDNSPITMSNHSWNEDLFEDLDTGDKILVLHDGIAESYPGQTAAYFCMELEEGSSANVPAEVLTALEELGYVIDWD